MKLNNLSKCLLISKDIPSTLSQLGLLSKTEILKEKKQRVAILERCIKFCKTAATRQENSYISDVLQFIHKVNEDDDWLLSTSAIVLPCLNRIYCEILAGADPSKKANTGTLNVAISSRVKKDKYALRALCGVFEVCLDFCDVVTDENQNHLGIFLRTSAAVLFGSDFQRERDTTCETEYAMDELARYSSFALSNILLTYPSVVSIAEAILGKRIPALFKSLSSSPELSIQRSLVFILRVLYDSSGKSTSSSRNLKSLIENELMSSRFGNGAALSLFKTFLLDADDAAEQGELVISKMFEKGEVESTCFKSEKCSVQQKDLGANKRRAPFQAVSIDWNRNSIVIHKGTKRQYWPIFSISSFEWRKGRKELYIQHNSFADRGYVDMTIRFAAGSISEENKVIIEERIRKIIAIEANTKESLDETCPLLDRKVSAVVSAPSPRAIEEEESLCTTRSSDENPSQNPSQIQENISSPFEKPERTIFSNIHADGILVLERKRKQDFEGGEDAQMPSRLEENKNDMDVMNSPVLEQEQRKTESSGGQPFPISKRRKKAVSNGRNKKNVDYPQASSSHSLLKCASSEKVKMPTASILPQEGTSNESESDQSWREGDLSGSEKGTADTNKTSSNPSPLASPVVASLREDSAQKPKNNSLGSEYQDASEGNEKSMDMRFGGEEHTRDNPVGGGCESDFSSCAHQESSQSRRGKMRSFLKEDEEMLKKLHYTVREILKWKTRQTAKIFQDSKGQINRIKEHKRNHDKNLTSTYVSNIHKLVSSHRRKIGKYKDEKEGKLTEARQRLQAMKKRLLDSKQALEALRNKISKDIKKSQFVMKEDHGKLTKDLEECISRVRRNSDSRARRTSMFQGLARLFGQ